MTGVMSTSLMINIKSYKITFKLIRLLGAGSGGYLISTKLDNQTTEEEL